MEIACSGGEDFVEGGGEGVGFAGLAVLTAEEPAVVTREGGGGDAEPFGHGDAGAGGESLAGLCADTDDDAGWGLAERPEVVVVVVARHDVQPDQRVVTGA